MVAPAPGLNSTVTVAPRFSRAKSAASRETTSPAPPAAKPTTIVTGRLGYLSWATATVAVSDRTAASAMAVLMAMLPSFETIDVARLVGTDAAGGEIFLDATAV